MKLSSESKSLINQTVSDLIEHFSNLEDAVITDIHFQPLFQSGELRVFDDDDNELGQVVVSEFEGLQGEESFREVAGILRRGLEHRRKALEDLRILKPYSFVLVDEDRETIEDLLLIDDDLLLADEALLPGFDEEMNAFLKHLLSDD